MFALESSAQSVTMAILAPGEGAASSTGQPAGSAYSKALAFKQSASTGICLNP
jgi:hypothetical protein